MAQGMPNSRILIVNHENISNNCYRGNMAEMLVPLCLFRMGGAAALLSNKYADPLPSSLGPLVSLLQAKGLCLHTLTYR